MRRAIGIAVLLLALVPATSAAQAGAYVFGGWGDVAPDDAFTFWKGPTWRAGGGYEYRFSSQLLFQTEIEFLQRPKSPGDQDTTLVSVNLGYEFGRAVVRPFLSGGYTLASRDVVFNYGGGVNIRLVSRLALRAEFRNHRLFFDVPIDSYGVRVGLTIR